MYTLGIFERLGPMELVIILVVALLLFGRRLPEVGKSLGKGIVEFKRGLKGIGDEIENESNRPPPPPAQAAPKKEIPAADERRVSRSDSVETPSQQA